MGGAPAEEPTRTVKQAPVPASASEASTRWRVRDCARKQVNAANGHSSEHIRHAKQFKLPLANVLESPNNGAPSTGGNVSGSRGRKKKWKRRNRVGAIIQLG